MLSDRLTDHLNRQINLKFYSGNLYLQMSTWATYKGLDGCAEFLRDHGDEEMGHMQKLFTYVNETGALARLAAIEAPPTKFESIEEVFKKSTTMNAMSPPRSMPWWTPLSVKRTTRPSIFCNGMPPSSMKRSVCSSRFWTSCRSLVPKGADCSTSTSRRSAWRSAAKRE